jgi:hypothetical protein
MRPRLVVLCLAFMSFTVSAQQKGGIEVSVGIGADIMYSTPRFKNDGNLFASIYYGISNQWGVIASFDQHVYKLYRFHTNDLSFLGGELPDIKQTLTSLLIGARYFIPTESKIADLYISMSLGSASSRSSSDGYYTASWIAHDTAFNRIESNQYLQGFLSFGAQGRPVRFLILFVDLQTSVAITRDPFMGPVAGKVGIGLEF